MLQRIHNILAWITINNSTQLSIYALKLQTKLTTRYPHLNKPTVTPEELLDELLEGVPLTADGRFLAFTRPKDLHLDALQYTEALGAYSQTLVNGVPIE